MVRWGRFCGGDVVRVLWGDVVRWGWFCEGDVLR